MTMMRFTKFINKLLSHDKKRTVRKKRKCNCGASIRVIPEGDWIHDKPRYKRDECICQIKKGDMLQVYALIKVGEAPVINVQKLVIADFTDEDAQKDGFEDCYDFEIGLQELHGDELYSEEFRIIDFDPQWPKQRITPFPPLGSIQVTVISKSMKAKINSKLSEIQTELDKILVSSRSRRVGRTARVVYQEQIKLLNELLKEVKE